MQIWTPAEPLRDDGEFPVRLNPGRGEPFAVINLSESGTTELVMQSPGDCDRLIKAAAEAKSLLLSEPVSAQDDAGRAIVADLDEQVTSDLCPATAPAGAGGKWMCTLPSGHKGRHEAGGALPLRVWEDGDKNAWTDAS